MVRQIGSLSVLASIAFYVLSASGDEPAPKLPAPPAAPTSAKPVTSNPSVTETVTPKTDADLAARVDDLEKKVALLERSNKALTDLVTSHSTSVVDLENQVAKLEQSNKEFTNIASNHSKMLRDIARGIETPSGQRFVPNVQAIRDDRDSRRELVDTVAEGLTRATGTLRIRNDMSTGQSLVVNGVTTVYAPPHEGVIITVPSGTATTELAGEGTKSWMIGAPNYIQDIVIAPAVRSTVGAWLYDPATGTYWRTLP